MYLLSAHNTYIGELGAIVTVTRTVLVQTTFCPTTTTQLSFLETNCTGCVHNSHTSSILFSPKCFKSSCQPASQSLLLLFSTSILMPRSRHPWLHFVAYPGNKTCFYPGSLVCFISRCLVQPLSLSLSFFIALFLSLSI